jgi:hypothetical protein
MQGEKTGTAGRRDRSGGDEREGDGQTDGQEDEKNDDGQMGAARAL